MSGQQPDWDETTIVVLCNYDRGSWTVSRQLAEVLGVDEPRK